MDGMPLPGFVECSRANTAITQIDRSAIMKRAWNIYSVMTASHTGQYDKECFRKCLHEAWSETRPSGRIDRSRQMLAA